MKHHGFIVLILGMCLFLSGCTSGSATIPNPASSDDSQALSFASPEGSELSRKFASGNMQLISSHNGLIATAYAGTSAGCYEIFYRPSGAGNIMYNDYTTAKLVYLSNQPNSSHNNSSDTSWIEYTGGGCYPVVGGDKLYLFKLNTPGFIDQLGEEGKGYIYQYNLDGSGKKTLANMEDNETLAGCGIAFDGENLYYLSVGIEPDGNTSSYQIMQVNTTTGKKSVLKSLSMEERHFIVGATGGSLVLKHIKNPAKVSLDSEQTNLAQQFANQIHTLSLCALDGEEKEVMQWKQDAISETIFNNNIVYWDAADKKIKSMGLFDQTEEIIVAQPIADATGRQYDFVSMYADSFDNHVLFSAGNMVEDTENLETYEVAEQEYAINMDSNTVAALNMTYANPLTDDIDTVNIYAEGEDVFFVITSKKEYALNDYLEDGQLYVTNLIVSVPAVIRKEDYWNNTPAYIELKDYVYK